MENTKDATTSGDAAAVATDNHGAAGNSQNSAPNAKPRTRNEVPLGTLAERLEILQQAAENYQKAGGRILVTYRQDRDILVIALPEAGKCVDCGHWFSGNEGCPYCARKISGNEVATKQNL